MKNKVRMLSSQMGVHDGELHPVHFAEGEEHEIGPDLLQAFINCGAVELVGAENGDAPDSEEKSEGDAPANKAKKAAPENKAKK